MEAPLLLDQANGIMQGFDEFMNLVIDDAVEVKQATKTDAESRRSLGQFYIPQEALVNYGLPPTRTNIAEGGQCVVDSKFTRITRIIWRLLHWV